MAPRMPCSLGKVWDAESTLSSAQVLKVWELSTNVKRIDKYHRFVEVLERRETERIGADLPLPLSHGSCASVPRY